MDFIRSTFKLIISPYINYRDLKETPCWPKEKVSRCGGGGRCHRLTCYIIRPADVSVSRITVHEHTRTHKIPSDALKLFSPKLGRGAPERVAVAPVWSAALILTALHYRNFSKNQLDLPLKDLGTIMRTCTSSSGRSGCHLDSQGLLSRNSRCATAHHCAL
ncbi:unnamed protein product [Caenorhabditis auriculariae]|uniref:Uncharacterized protein n=1 Tax=Caenorhabditis auriculariae TaxID=2777116 RepID=A0A8S1HWD5_9PELO|nr:unnamed protein product [Caenorhabditis auriculariae]